DRRARPSAPRTGRRASRSACRWKARSPRRRASLRRAWRPAHRRWSTARSCPAPCFVAVGERTRHLADGLAAFVTLARDHQHVALRERLDGGADGFGAVADLGRIGTAHENLATYLRRLFAAWIVVGDDDRIGEAARGLAHQRTLAVVAVAAAAEHDDEPARRMRPHRGEHRLQRV